MSCLNNIKLRSKFIKARFDVFKLDVGKVVNSVRLEVAVFGIICNKMLSSVLSTDEHTKRHYKVLPRRIAASAEI